MPHPTLSPESVPVKMLLIGDSGTGKTGAFASLVKAGYELLVLDFDGDFNNSYCVNDLRAQPNAAELLGRVHYHSLRDKFKIVGRERVPDGTPKAFMRGLDLMTHWKDDEEDLGPNSTWGIDKILIIDSLSYMARAAFTHQKYNMMSAKDERTVYFAAQQIIDSVLMRATADDLRCNIIITSHIRYLELDNGLKRGFPEAIGSAMSPSIAKTFNIMLEAALKGNGPNATRIIRTVPSMAIGNKQPIPAGVPDELSIERGLADYFALYRKLQPSNNPETAP